MLQVRKHIGSCASVVRHVARGVAIGIADLVPGVSGATIALLLGIYPNIIRALACGSECAFHLVRGQWRAARYALIRIEWRFCLSLTTGVVVALLLFPSVLLWLIAHCPAHLFAVFFGMTLTVIAIIGQKACAHKLRGLKLQKTRLHSVTLCLLGMGGIAIGVAFFMISSLTTKSEPSLLFLCVAASCAVCAMLLPGISGSFVLLLFGAYQPILQAVSGYAFNILVPVSISMVLTALCFSRLLHWLVLHYYQQLLVFFAGLLVGGLLALWPWSQVTTILSSYQQVAIIACICVGSFLVFIIHRFSGNSYETA